MTTLTTLTLAKLAKLARLTLRGLRLLPIRGRDSHASAVALSALAPESASATLAPARTS